MSLKPWEFEALTPGELYDMAEGYRWRREQKSKESVALAWYIAVFGRVKKLKPLDKYLSDNGANQPKSIEEARNDYEDVKRRLGLS